MNGCWTIGDWQVGQLTDVELRNQNSGPAPFRYLLPGGGSHRAQVVPGQLVSEPGKLTVGGVEFVLIPIAGGETTTA